MKPIFLSRLSYALLLALCAAAFSRAEGPSPAVPIETVVEEIGRNNPELLFYEQEIAAARTGERVAGMWNNPELGLQGGRKTVSDPGGTLSGEGAAWSVSVTQTFEWPGRLDLRKAIANRQIKLAELGLARFKAALAARARNLAYGLMAAQEKADATDEVAGRYGALRELFLSREPGGITPLLETRVIEAQELAIKRRAADARLAAQAAAVELNQLRGAPLDACWQPANGNLVFRSAPPLAALLAAAKENNFEFRMKKVELEEQGLEVSLARNERYPAVSVGPFMSQDKAGDRETVVGLSLSVPLPLNSRSRAGVDLAEVRRRQAETQVLVAERDLEREVITAQQTYSAKLESVASWKPESVAQFRDAAALADRHYRLGAVPLATYVELQGAYLDAVEALLDTKREALEAGQQIELLTGLDFKAVELQP
ncbi:MAG TPA: TolC family protein [Bryobacteraceae bacterium]|nr:TolC family protein [Bryobacteraceae bacterium]